MVSGFFGSMGGWDTEPVSIEIWFKPNSTADDEQSNGQVLFETGGGTGLGIFYNDGTIEVGHDTTEVISSVDVSSLVGEFIQVVLTYDVTGSDDFTLYVNGGSPVTGNRSDSDWSGTDGAGLGARGASNVGGRGNGDSSTESFEGQIAIFRAYRNKILSAAEVLQNYESVSLGAVATASLTGTANDVDGQSLTPSWSLLSGPGGTAFSNSAGLSTNATFTVAGTYVLLLTVDDGIGSNSSQVTVVVNPPASSIYTSWAGGSFTNPFNETDPGRNDDGDRYSSMMEFAFGLDPTIADGGSLAMDGLTHGEPVVTEAAGNVLQLYFIRRRDHGSSGSVSYTVQFSADLSGFSDNDNGTNPISKVMDSGVDGVNYELMKVAYPAGMRFGRIEVEFVP